MDKTITVALGAAAGYFLFRKKPLVGLALGGAAGYMVGGEAAPGGASVPSTVPTSEALRERATPGFSPAAPLLPAGASGTSLTSAWQPTADILRSSAPSAESPEAIVWPTLV